MSQLPSTPFQNTCYFCGKDDGRLHEVTSFRLDRRVGRCAYILVETEQILIGKLSCGDMIAQEAKYHAACLANLYKKADRIQLGLSYSDDQMQAHGLAFAAVVSFIEEEIESADSEENECVFKLSDLVKIYCSRLEELHIEISSRIHSTRLKERIISQFEDMRAFNQGREVYLAYDIAIAEALKTASNISYEDEAYILVQASRIVRRGMKLKSHDKFDGSFLDKCQDDFVSYQLFELISMILQGTSACNMCPCRRQAALSVAQLIEFN